MSSVGNVNSRILDATFDRQNLRCEFRLPSNSAFLSDFRLINIGLTSDNADDAPHRSLGILGAIKRVTLFDGSTQLDTIATAPIYQAFRNLNKANDTNMSEARHLNYNQLGYLIQGNYTIGGDNQFGLTVPNVHQQGFLTYGGSALNSKEAWISLKELLPFLRSSMVLPTNVYRQLRVVVEYNSSAEMRLLTQKTNSTKNTRSNSLLLVEELQEGDMKDSIMNQYQGVVYRPIEHEQVSVPASTATLADTPAQATSVQRNNYLINGFNNKKLIKLAIVKSPTVENTFVTANELQGFGSLSSIAPFKESVQIRVNGQNMIAGEGISGSPTGSSGNRQLSYLNDSWGIFNIVSGSQFSALANNARYLPTGITALQGQQSYIGLNIDATIAELQLHYDRTLVFDNDENNQPYNLNLYGEVEKAVVMNKDGTYNVIYVN